jgi:molybdate transport system substrate-binding protein
MENRHAHAVRGSRVRNGGWHHRLAARGRGRRIKIMSPAPMRTAIVDLAARFERKTPHKITFIHLPSSFIVDRVKGGEAVDVTILTARASDDLIKTGKLARRVDIARSSIGIAVRAGAPTPDVSSAEAFKRTLLAVKSFARNEGAESGVHAPRI